MVRARNNYNIDPLDIIQNIFVCFDEFFFVEMRFQMAQNLYKLEIFF
jgi:hypothetical protein